MRYTTKQLKILGIFLNEFIREIKRKKDCEWLMNCMLFGKEWKKSKRHTTMKCEGIRYPHYYHS